MRAHPTPFRWLARHLAGMSLTLALAGPASSAAPPPALPIADAHLHYSHDAWAVVPTDQVIALMRQAGLRLALVSSSDDEGTQRLHRAAPDLVVPSLRPYRTRADASGWTRDPAIITHLEERLRRFRYAAIGEFHLYGAEADLPVPRRLVAMAREHGLILHAHSDADAIERLFAQHPQARILWAHAGFERPEAVRAMLRRHPRLWADLAFRNDPGSGSEVDPAWREAFMEFPERFMLGTDTFTPERLHYIPVHAEWARGWLAALPPALAERIAWRNAEALLLPVWQANRAAVDPAPDCPAPAEGWRLASATLALSVRPEPASPRVGEPFSLHIALCPAAGGRTVDSLLVDATMPEHRHGMNYRPQVHRVDARHFRADGLLLHMPGRWELVLETRGAAGGERLTQEIRLP